MSDNIFQIIKPGISPIGNRTFQCDNCLATCDSKSSRIVTCTVDSKERRVGKVVGKDGTEVFLCTSEVIKSTRIFREKLDIFLELSDIIVHERSAVIANLNLSIKRFIHNLVTLNGTSLNSIYSVISQETFSQSNRDNLIYAVRGKVQSKQYEIVTLIIDLLKNQCLVKAQFSVYTKLYENEPVSIMPFSAHKLFLLVLNTFWDDFNGKHVKLDVGGCYDRIMIDYECFVAVLVHLLDNAAKYILPKSTLKIRFNHTANNRLQLIFDMQSLQVRPEEEQDIFKEGRSGALPTHLSKSGSGIGLFQVRELLALCDSTVTFLRDQDATLRTRHEGEPYENNIFIVSVPLAG